MDLKNYDYVIFDTSILLTLYEYDYKTIENILELLKKHKDKIWLSFQVLEEFEKNYKKQKIKNKAISNYNTLKLDLSKEAIDQLEKIKIKLNEVRFEYRKKGYDIDPIIDNLTPLIECSKNKVSKEIQSYIDNSQAEVESNKEYHNQNNIKEFIDSIPDNQKSKKFTINELISIYSEGEIRYKYKIPPGYMDIDKPNLNKFGDLIIWKDILKFTKNINKKILFVTNDLKEDWIENEKLRPELIQEFKENSSKSELTYYNLHTFIKNNILLDKEKNIVNFISEDIENQEGKITKRIKEKLQDSIEDLLDSYLKINEIRIEVDIIEVEIEEVNISEITKFNLEDFYHNKVYKIPLEGEVSAKITVNENFSTELELDIIINLKIEEVPLAFKEIEIEFMIISSNLDTIEICAICNKDIGVNFYGSEMICSNCSIELECCTVCGHIFESDEIYGGKCFPCYMKYED